MVNDLDAESAQAVAAEIGGIAVPGDVGAAGRPDRGRHGGARRDRPVLRQRRHRGPAGSTPQTPDDVWERIVDVNVMAHVYVARALLPRWLEDGQGGRFVSPCPRPGC